MIKCCCYCCMDFTLCRSSGGTVLIHWWVWPWYSAQSRLQVTRCCRLAPSWSSSRGSVAYSLVEVVHWEYSVHLLMCLSALWVHSSHYLLHGAQWHTVHTGSIQSFSFLLHVYNCVLTDTLYPVYNYFIYRLCTVISSDYCHLSTTCAVWLAYHEQWLWLRCTWWLCPAWSTEKHSRWSNIAGLLLHPTRDSQASWLTLKSKRCLRCVPPKCGCWGLDLTVHACVA